MGISLLLSVKSPPWRLFSSIFQGHWPTNDPIRSFTAAQSPYCKCPQTRGSWVFCLQKYLRLQQPRGLHSPAVHRHTCIRINSFNSLQWKTAWAVRVSVHCKQWTLTSLGRYKKSPKYLCLIILLEIPFYYTSPLLTWFAQSNSGLTLFLDALTAQGLGCIREHFANS